MIQKGKGALRKAGMFDNSKPECQKFWAVAKEILACEGEIKHVSCDTIDAILNSSELFNELRWGNVFAYHSSTDTVGFQSRPIQLVAETYLKEKEEKARW